MGHSPCDRRGPAPVGKSLAHAARLGQGQGAAWDASLCVWLEDQEQGGYGDTGGASSSSSLPRGSGWQCYLPWTKQPLGHHSRSRWGLAPPSLFPGAPRRPSLCGPQGAGPLGWSHLGQAQHVEPHRYEGGTGGVGNLPQNTFPLLLILIISGDGAEARSLVSRVQREAQQGGVAGCTRPTLKESPWPQAQRMVHSWRAPVLWERGPHKAHLQRAATPHSRKGHLPPAKSTLHLPLRCRICLLSPPRSTPRPLLSCSSGVREGSEAAPSGRNLCPPSSGRTSHGKHWLSKAGVQQLLNPGPSPPTSEHPGGRGEERPGCLFRAPLL